jgi:hypothetical protein
MTANIHQDEFESLDSLKTEAEAQNIEAEVAEKQLEPEAPQDRPRSDRRNKNVV